MLIKHLICQVSAVERKQNDAENHHINLATLQRGARWMKSLELPLQASENSLLSSLFQSCCINSSGCVIIVYSILKSSSFYWPTDSPMRTSLILIIMALIHKKLQLRSEISLYTCRVTLSVLGRVCSMSQCENTVKHLLHMVRNN